MLATISSNILIAILRARLVGTSVLCKDTSKPSKQLLINVSEHSPHPMLGKTESYRSPSLKGSLNT